MRRSFVTPEGVDLALELGSAGNRATAFLIDATLMLLLLIAVSVVLAFTLSGANVKFVAIVWLLGFFVLRNGWFTLFEMGARGATPGKRMMRLRVVARDGARLTGSAVIARNALREIEIFLPLSFLAQQTAKGTADTFLVVFSLLWSGIFLFFPLFNRDRLRVGDLVAGTWVIQINPAAVLKEDLVSSHSARRVFPENMLKQYGIYELQTLEQVLRHEQPTAIATVAQTIRDKFNLPSDGDDYGFLFDFYGALCARLESRMILGQRRETKFDS
jgi:uncharacterized RDD family membrane protein YckC